MSTAGGDSGQGGTISSHEGPFFGPLKPLLVPLRFSVVAQSVDVGSSSATSPLSLYKGGFPRRRNLPFLSRLRLKTIVSLTPKSLNALDEDVSQWAKNNNVSLVHVKCEKPKDDGGGLSKDAAAKALMHILDSRQLPLYIHCLDGQSVSTLMVAVLRKVQAWSIRATVEEINQSLGYDEEVIGYQTSFVEKFGKTDGVRLPPRRYIPDWTWTDPSPLKRLKDPYDVIVPREKPADRSTANTSANGSLSNQHKRYESNDCYFAAGSTNPSPTITGAAFGVGLLPVQHPLLRVKFDVDPDLPPPPPPTGTLTPLHTRDGIGLFSPATSRPSSRAGRNTSHGHPLHPHHHHNSDARGMSRSESALESPRRKVLSVEHSPSLGNYSGVSLGDGPFSPPIHHTDFVSSRLAHGSSSSDTDELHDGALDGSPSKRLSGARSTLQDSHDSSTPTKSSLLLNQSTPRASTSLLEDSVRPVSTRGAVFGLGLNNEESRERTDVNGFASSTAHPVSIRHRTLESERPMTLGRSVSEMVKSPRSQQEAQMRSIDQEEEYYSDTHEDTTGSPKKRSSAAEYRQGSGSEIEAHSYGSDEVAGDKEEEKREEEAEVEEEEEEEELEEEEEDESDEEDDDGLALEALDLEGY
jgi:hypothetical protein